MPEQKDLKIDTVEMQNVEILETGTWNGFKVTEKDIDEMVVNFEKKVLEPYLNLDHDDKFTDRVKKALSVVSLGFVSQLRRDGKKLIANFIQVPKKVAELIKSGMLKKRSVEFFPRGFKVNGEAFTNVLKAVSFFGADIPAVNSLSNDFDILLKSNLHAVSLSNNTESKKILFNHNDGGNKRMETIEVSKKEYTDLVTFKSTNEPELAKLQAENESLVKSNDELSGQVKDNEKEIKELKTFKENAIEQNKVSLEKEANDFISGVIKDGKLLPKFKADKVADYIEKASDENKLKLFKEDLESRDRVIELGELKDEQGNATKDAGSMSNDEINEAIEAKMKKTGKTWEQVAPDFGLIV
jgi:hypothetical protein